VTENKIEHILAVNFKEGKLSVAEIATILAAMDCLTYEIENKGPQSSRLLEEYGTQIQQGIASLQTL
jgi:hypothetical protein